MAPLPPYRMKPGSKEIDTEGGTSKRQTSTVSKLSKSSKPIPGNMWDYRNHPGYKNKGKIKATKTTTKTGKFDDFDLF